MPDAISSSENIQIIPVAGEGVRVVSVQGSGPPGEPGPAGETGPAGPGFLYRGVWSNVTAYAVNDIVTRSGSGYVCILAHSNQDPTGGTGGTYWGLIAAKGDSGSDGSVTSISVGTEDGWHILWAAVWNTGVTYAKGNIVRFVEDDHSKDNWLYICKTDHTSASGNKPPDALTGPDLWDVFLPRGPQGRPGDKGDASTVPGPTGPKGDPGDRGLRGYAGTNGATGISFASLAFPSAGTNGFKAAVACKLISTEEDSGPTFVYKKNGSTLSNIPSGAHPCSLAIGDIFTATASGTWTGTKYAAFKVDNP